MGVGQYAWSDQKSDKNLNQDKGVDYIRVCSFVCNRGYRVTTSGEENEIEVFEVFEEEEENILRM